mgnify:CR=1 FL=1
MMHSCRVLCAVFVGMLLPEAVSAEGGYRDFAQAPHDYFLRTPTDRFTRLKAEIESGRLRLDRSDERAFVRSLLDVLGIPVSSQMLVFSTTSLQLSRISPSNPLLGVVQSVLPVNRTRTSSSSRAVWAVLRPLAWE